ncbi:MAG: hypothetical protein IJZ95_03740 [Oscillospiraceae bacterium]|nr:hypothetical protein [Oscillospiraceae bacterium]
MDIKAKIEEIVEKVKNDPNFAEKFKKEPIKAVEDVLGVDLPDEVVNNVIDGVKSKVNFDGIADKIGGLFGGFGKKD